jgi:hypothetical protein
VLWLYIANIANTSVTVFYELLCEAYVLRVTHLIEEKTHPSQRSDSVDHLPKAGTIFD